MPRKKPSQFLPDATFTFDDTAVLMFNTHYDNNYQFVIDLNKAYRLHLARVDDLELEGRAYPCFSFNDEYSHLAYVMIERPSLGGPDRIFDYYDKMVLVRGMRAWEVQEGIFRDIAEGSPEPPMTDLLEYRRWVLTDGFRQRIFGVDTFCFSSRRGNATSMFSGPAELAPKATTSYLNRLRKFLEAAFDTLQWHLCEELA